MKNRSFNSLKYIVLVYLLLTVVYPLVRLFMGIKVEDIYKVLGAEQFVPMLYNSLVTTITATIISVALAFLLALGLWRSWVRIRSLWVIVFTLPMLIPSISHGMGLILLLGDNGILTNLLGINVGIYGYLGIILGSVMYSFPVAFLLFFDSFQYEDFTTYEAARVLGLNKLQQFRTITIPNMQRAMVSSVLAVFTMIFTDYGVPLMTGGTVMTLPVYMYREVIGMMNFSGGAVVGLVLILPAVIAFIIDLSRGNDNSGSTTTRRIYQVECNRKRDFLVYVLCFTTFIFLSLPIIAFVCLSFVEQYPINMNISFGNIMKLLSGGIGAYFINSIAIALMTSLVGTSLAYFVAYATARLKQHINKIMHFISLLSLAIPGVVLGLSFVISFNQLPIYPTIFILIMVNIVHFFSSPYLLAYNSLTKFNANFEDVAATLGISRWRMLFNVYVPSTISTIIEMYSYFFVNAMVTISAVSFLVNFKTMTLAMMIPQLESQSFIEGTAIVSLLILIVNLLERTIVFLVKGHNALKGNNMTIKQFLYLSQK